MRGSAGATGSTATALQGAMPAGAARNALDCAFWDFEAKRAGKPVHELAGLPAPQPLVTAYTISLGTPEAMAEAAREPRPRKLLKVKLGGDGRSGAHPRGARGRAAGRADRRRQRGVARRESRRQSRRLRGRRRHAGRAAAAGRRRRGARRDRAADPGLRRRERARPRVARRARRAIRRGQHQARQDRRADRGAGDGRARPSGSASA